jgi:hypothetical protein
MVKKKIIPLMLKDDVTKVVHLTLATWARSCVSVEVPIALMELGVKLKHPLIQINFHKCGRVQGSKSQHSKMDSHVKSPKVSQILELIFGNQTLSNFGFLWTIGKV